MPKPYPTHPVTVGDNIRKKRMEISLLQKDVARILEVDETTIQIWETNRGGTDG